MIPSKSRYTVFEVIIMKEEKNKKEKEDATQYGEFISSFFAWKTLDEQKKIADKLANITDEKEE